MENKEIIEKLNVLEHKMDYKTKILTEETINESQMDSLIEDLEELVNILDLMEH